MSIEIHNRIAVLRTARGVSRKELADAVGVNHQTIGYLERGDYGPSLVLAMQIARFFGLPVELVFSFEPFEALESQLLRTAPRPVAEMVGTT
ncbi:MAG: helix-turn-helix transcriptional regulator [Gemmatimonadaceae bacterium]|jgi:DNA-binding XRE family transcriptional regulator|nr:helix-turn-helix transcriptional regulator [Gemmatimonadaceae bacterium]